MAKQKKKTTKVVVPKMATNVTVGYQTGSSNTLYSSWTWNTANTDKYNVKWTYYTGNGVWFVGSETTTTYTNSTYSMPSNATQVRFTVQPVAKTHKKGRKQVAYWSASWSTVVTFDKSGLPIDAPETPEIEIQKFNLTAEVDYYGTNATHIEFEVVKNDTTRVYSGMGRIVTNHASVACNISAGTEYKARCRAVLVSGTSKRYSEWSEYCDNASSIPSQVGTVTPKVLSESSVELTWPSIPNATGYTVEYATDKTYFDASDDVQSSDVNIARSILTGLESGKTWYFRVRATNDAGEGGWSGIVSAILGTTPGAPTTWAYMTDLEVGEDAVFNWVHNCEDGSSQTAAEIQVTVDGTTSTYSVTTESKYVLNTSRYSDGSVILWKVRTKGLVATWGEWSTQRQINLYAPPTVGIGLYSDQECTTLIETLNAFPMFIGVAAGPSTQSAISFYISIVANEPYYTTDNIGRDKRVSEGEEVYAHSFDASGNDLIVRLTPADVDLENNVSYTISVTVAMNTGLTATATYDFTVGWEDEEYLPNAEVTFDEDILCTYIEPFCDDEFGNRINDVTLAVYRREYNGSFTEIMSGIEGGSGTSVTDPHPALDYARYRIVATSNSTGSISFYDLPGIPIDCDSIVIQWDDAWANFEANDPEELVDPPWTGSMLKLPYNIDVQTSESHDVGLVQYIGRSHPVSYYGTQHGEQSTWNTDIRADDEETIYQIRRLSSYMGDVYVREPSGLGYWAKIDVSYKLTHMKTVIPVTFNITRVEGGT